MGRMARQPSYLKRCCASSGPQVCWARAATSGHVETSSQKGTTRSPSARPNSYSRDMLSFSLLSLWEICCIPLLRLPQGASVCSVLRAHDRMERQPFCPATRNTVRLLGIRRFLGATCHCPAELAANSNSLLTFVRLTATKLVADLAEAVDWDPGALIDSSYVLFLPKHRYLLANSSGFTSVLLTCVAGSC